MPFGHRANQRVAIGQAEHVGGVSFLVLPDYFLVARHFEQLYLVAFGVVAGDDRVAVGKTLAGVDLAVGPVFHRKMAFVQLSPPADQRIHS